MRHPSRFPRLSVAGGIQVAVRGLLTHIDPDDVQLHVISCRPELERDHLDDQNALGETWGYSPSMNVGGLAMHWGGISPRYSPEDFALRVREALGLPEEERRATMRALLGWTSIKAGVPNPIAHLRFDVDVHRTAVAHLTGRQREDLQRIGAGGLSGKPLTRRASAVIRYLRQTLGPGLPIIGVGGIMSAEDAIEKLEAGADLVQIYTGFIYEGPALVKAINKKILSRK